MEREVKAASDASRIREGYLGALGRPAFAFVDGFESQPARLRVEGPPGWPVFATLAPVWPLAAASVEARVADYYELADGQVVMGPRAVVRRLGEIPVPLYLAGYAEGPVDFDRVGRLATTALQRVSVYFGSIPFSWLFSLPVGTGAGARLDLVCRGLWAIRRDHGARRRHA